MTKDDKLKRLKTFCPPCSQKTNHEVIHEYYKHYTPQNTPEMGIDSAEGTWQIVRCMGCESVSFREFWLTSEDYHPIRGPEGTEKRYPSVGPDDLYEQRYTLLPERIRRIYQEIISTYNNGNVTACGGLIRSIIEGIANECADSFNLLDIKKVPKGMGIIEWKVSRLVEHKILSESHGDILHESRVLGNLAIHELEAPKQKELRKLIRIIEFTLNLVFEISEILEEMRWKRNQRKERKKG